MDAKQMREVLGRPEAARYKALGKGVRVAKVFGRRVLVRTIEPWTELDEYQKKGLAVPDKLKKEYQPLSSMGVIAQLGEELIATYGGELENEMPFKCGEFVMFSKFAGTDIRISEADFRILSIDEIQCSLEIDNVEYVKDDDRVTNLSGR